MRLQQRRRRQCERDVVDRRSELGAVGTLAGLVLGARVSPEPDREEEVPVHGLRNVYRMPCIRKAAESPRVVLGIRRVVEGGKFWLKERDIFQTRPPIRILVLEDAGRGGVVKGALAGGVRTNGEEEGGVWGG